MSQTKVLAKMSKQSTTKTTPDEDSINETGSRLFDAEALCAEDRGTATSAEFMATGYTAKMANCIRS